MKLKIAVDVDNVILDIIGKFIERYNQTNGTSVKFDDWDNWDYHQKLGMSDEIAYSWFRDIQANAMEMEALDWRIASYLEKMNEYFVVDIVSARPRHSLPALIKKLSSLGIEKNSHYRKIVTVPTHPKDAKIRCNYDIYLDDNPNLARSLNEKNGKKILLYDQPWNRQIECNKNVYRVKNWKESYERLIKLVATKKGIKIIAMNSIHGTPIIHQTFDEINDPFKGHDNSLVTALVTALKMFANTLHGEEIEMIETTSYRIILLPSMASEVIFFIVADYTFDKFDGIYLLEKIRDEVLVNYREKFIGKNLIMVDSKIKKYIKVVIDTLVMALDGDKVLSMRKRLKKLNFKNL